MGRGDDFGVEQYGSITPSTQPVDGLEQRHCSHDRLNEDGCCRVCGTDMRSGVATQPETELTPEQQTTEDCCENVGYWCPQCISAKALSTPPPSTLARIQAEAGAKALDDAIDEFIEAAGRMMSATGVARRLRDRAAALMAGLGESNS